MTIEKPKCVWERYIKAKDKQKVEIISTITDNIVDTYYNLNEAELRYRFISRLLIGYFDDLILFMDSKNKG